MEEIEIWKDIGIYKGVDFTGYFEVSTLGNIRSLDRWITTKDGKKCFYKGEIRKLFLNPSGYLQLTLNKGCQHKTVKVHRLVMDTFKPNPNPKIYTQVNHIDEDKTNNKLSNLEWCTASENINHGTRNERMAKKIKEKFTPVLEFDFNKNLLNTYYSVDDFCDERTKANIINIINNGCYICYKHFWIKQPEYDSLNENDFNILIENKINEYKERQQNIIKDHIKQVVQLDCNGNVIAEFSSCVDAAQKMGCTNTAINRCTTGVAKTCCGYIWLYKEDYSSINKDDLQQLIYNNTTNGNSKKILQLDLDGNIVKEWKSASYASKELGYGVASISQCIRGRTKTSHGFKWVLAE